MVYGKDWRASRMVQLRAKIFIDSDFAKIIYISQYDKMLTVSLVLWMSDFLSQQMFAGWPYLNLQLM